MTPYERLQAWNSAHALVLRVYRTTESWPTRELYGLTSQARRAAFSVAANIAEGAAKRGRHEFRRYLDIALGSFAELRYVLRVGRDLGLLSVQECEDLQPSIDLAGKLLWGLYRRMTR
jgi:four helix bundle protein